MTTAMPQGTAPKRSRARALLPFGVLVWIALEIWLLTLVGDAAGGLVVFLILVAGVVLGSVVVKTAGRRAFHNLRQTLQQQQRRQQAPESGPDAREEAGTAAHTARNGFLMLGGLLIMIPGLLTDAVGLLLLIPPVRSLVGGFADRSMEKRVRASVPDDLQDAFQQARRTRMGQDGKVVQGEVVRDDEPGGGRPRGDEGPRPPLLP
ncbi:FxsA family membrane protein [Streptomyces fuscigenes]|uniref:FxsA family membrane protein n=1 Tax=Streptomyces fuscigenes TaxID=1528880 RepID=UPI001F2DF9EB|nr:FxsA family membrane protein [Streptomyces fuscigenes]MCF3963606.1 FxsA family protein [Streptomyces fuscigenes]